jgi:hypothetical protein
VVLINEPSAAGERGEAGVRSAESSSSRPGAGFERKRCVRARFRHLFGAGGYVELRRGFGETAAMRRAAMASAGPGGRRP